VHSGGERRLLELLLYRLRLEAFEPRRADESDGVHEARQLIAREQALLQERVAR
jgi:hypothetical protein